MVPLKYLSNFCRTLNLLLVNWKVNLYLTWSVSGIIKCSIADQARTLVIINTKPYVPVVTLTI